MNFATPESLRIAREIVDSSRVLRTFAACEWDELTDDGKHWISAIVQEAQARAVTGSVRDAMRRGGVKPAPFALSPMLVSRALKAVDTPVLSAPLVDRPSQPPVAAIDPTEPARCAPMQAAPSAPAESSPPALGRPDTFATSGTPATTVVPISVTSRPARKSDVKHRQAKDRDARELEAPVDHTLLDRRREVIRAAATRVQAREKIALPVASTMTRVSPGRAPAKSATLPVLGSVQRLAALAAAIVFLKRECILVTVCDRDAQIRTYRVSGKANAMLASEVIEFAIKRGFEVPA